MGVRTMPKNDRYLQIAIEAAKKAGQIQKLNFGHSHQVEYKGVINPVSEVDKLCEQSIVRMISNDFKDHDIMTEESSFKKKGSSWRWIIDPLDGTTNYVHGYPFFCVSIGLEVEGEMELGVVYDPMRDELFHVEKGRGAYLNGEKIFVSPVDHLDRGLLVTGFPYDVREHADFYLSYFRQFMMKSFAIRRDGSAALNLCYLAAGRFDGYWELKIQAWDIASGCLMVTEAGGEVSDFQGQPYSIYSGEILASNHLIHDEMLKVMKEVSQKVN